MANKLYEENSILDIANAIREKNGTSDTYTVAEMGDAVRSIESGSGSGGWVDELNSLLNGTLTEIENNEITTLRNNGFQALKSLTKATFNNITNIGEMAFQNCTNLTEVIAPNVENVANQAFRGCTVLKNANFPKVKTLWYSCFADCKALTKAIHPSVTRVMGATFAGCTELKYAQFDMLNQLGTTAFDNCSSLEVVVIKSKNCTLSNINAFVNCTANVYVKKEDLEWYSTATNWSVLYAENRILAIEDNLEVLNTLGYVA